MNSVNYKEIMAPIVVKNVTTLEFYFDDEKVSIFMKIFESIRMSLKPTVKQIIEFLINSNKKFHFKAQINTKVN